jgi:hypothetical protein
MRWIRLSCSSSLLLSELDSSIMVPIDNDVDVRDVSSIACEFYTEDVLVQTDEQLMQLSSNALAFVHDYADIGYDNYNHNNNNNNNNNNINNNNNNDYDYFVSQLYEASRNDKSVFVQNLLNLKTKQSYGPTIINNICALIHSSFVNIPEVQRDVPLNYYQLEQIIRYDKPLIIKVSS